MKTIACVAAATASITRGSVEADHGVLGYFRLMIGGTRCAQVRCAAGYATR